jgi:DMSO reductase family type II enzyme heme b subunit
MGKMNWVWLAVGLALASAGLTGCGGDGAGGGDAAAPATELRVGWVRDGALPALDPLASAWDEAVEVSVQMLPQDVMEPRVPETTPTRVSLKGLHDGKRVAFRLVWADSEPQALIDVDRSSDAVAIQLPATGAGGPLPDAMMGEGGKPVLIAQWRLALQERLEGKPYGIKALYPNAVNDHYPFEGARDPSTRRVMETRYAPARAAGNPVAAAEVTSAVQDLVAEGFGSLAFSGKPVSTGKGVHRDGKWHVTISRPLDLEPGAKTVLRPGASTYIALAIWDGGKRQTGSKKMRSIWVPLSVEGVEP